MKVYIEPGGRREGIKNGFQVRNMLGVSSNDDEGIVSILKNRTGEVVDKWVEEKASARGMKDALLQHIGDNVKEERGEGIALAKPLATLNPSSRDIIEKHRRLTRGVDEADPGAPEVREAFGLQDPVKSVPTDGVKRFSEVQFEDRCRSRALMASLNNVSSVDEIFGNGAARNKPRLVRMNEIREKRA